MMATNRATLARKSLEARAADRAAEEEARLLWYRLDNRNWELHPDEHYHHSRLYKLATLAKARYFRRTGRVDAYRAELRFARAL